MTSTPAPLPHSPLPDPATLTNPRNILSDLDIHIVGEGNIGEKARQLIAKTGLLRELGFHTPPCIVVAQDFFNPFFLKNNLGFTLQDADKHADAESIVARGRFTRELFRDLSSVCSAFSSPAIVVRSSAEGDARGTGTYQSAFCGNRIEGVLRMTRQVLASYFSPAAREFRRDAATGEGFGIIFEPLICEPIGQTYGTSFAPLLSGFGYTSTSRGPGYLNVVPGGGGGVESGDGQKITRADLGDCKNIDEFQRRLFRQLVKSSGARAPLSALLNSETIAQIDRYKGYSFSPPNYWNKHGSWARSTLYVEGEQKTRFDTLDLRPLFPMFEDLERRIGKPQYFEWALTAESGKPRCTIIQIADVDKRLDMMDFDVPGEIMLSGNIVTGTGRRVCTKIANCWNPHDIAALHEFNRHNRDYLLLFSSRVTMTKLGDVPSLKYSDFSNASVFLEIQDAAHAGDPVAHLGGQLDMTNKLFAVLTPHGEHPIRWDLLRAGEKQINGLTIFDRPVTVIASERQDKLIVTVESDVPASNA